jgi:microcystin-dependent protein
MTDTLAMTQLFDTGGTYPSRDGGSAISTLAMVHSMAAAYPAYGAPDCDGRMLQVMNNQALTSLIGTMYGGDGAREIGLPDLRGRTATGGGPLQPPVGMSLPMTYMIAAEAGGAWPILGAIGLFAGNFVPAGWLAADGSPMTIPQNVPLFEAIGTAFGGNPDVFFKLPDLGQCAAIGAGDGVALGQSVPAGSDGIAGLGVNYLICVDGGFAPNGGGGGFPPSAATLGEVIAFAGASAPAGWAYCDGSLLQVSDYQALFELIGTTYGGDGQDNFALPDLRGRMLTGPPR